MLASAATVGALASAATRPAMTWADVDEPQPVDVGDCARACYRMRNPIVVVWGLLSHLRRRAG